MRKNLSAYIPLNTMWIRFKAAGETNGIPDPRLSDIDIKIADLNQLEPALQDFGHPRVAEGIHDQREPRDRILCGNDELPQLSVLLGDEQEDAPPHLGQDKVFSHR